jgi:ribosomal protein S12 methylthiotransferase accessory factor
VVASIGLDIEVPPAFPEKCDEALVRAANPCAVTTHLESPPGCHVRTVVR